MSKVRKNSLILLGIVVLLGGQLLLMGVIFDGPVEDKPLAEEKMITVTEEEALPFPELIEEIPPVVEVASTETPAPIEEAPFVEKTGGEGVVGDRLAENEGQVPEEVLSLIHI